MPSEQCQLWDIMENRDSPIIDMTKEGEFVDPPEQPYFRGVFDSAPVPLSQRIKRTLIVIAILAAVICIAALAFWFVLLVICASAVAWVAFRIKLWWMRRG